MNVQQNAINELLAIVSTVKDDIVTGAPPTLF